MAPIKPGRTPPFGNTTAKGLCSCPLQILFPCGLLILRSTLSTCYCHRRAYRCTRLHLDSHSMEDDIANVMAVAY